MGGTVGSGLGTVGSITGGAVGSIGVGVVPPVGAPGMVGSAGGGVPIGFCP